MATATTTKAMKGFRVCCPFCGDSEATVHMDLNALTTCTCSGCDEEFSPQAAREKAAETLKRWEAVCRWVELAPMALNGGDED